MPVFISVRIQENLGESFMYWFRARGYVKSLSKPCNAMIKQKKCGRRPCMSLLHLPISLLGVGERLGLCFGTHAQAVTMTGQEPVPTRELSKHVAFWFASPTWQV